MDANDNTVAKIIDHAAAPAQVDQVNARFYGRTPYPWPPATLDQTVERGFWSRMLGQDIGAWGRRVVPEGGRIWVAGCGTNQALVTALRFPEARVLGTDLSASSLAACERNARQLGVDNLELAVQSINEAEHVACFDYVLCTGVIHHNAHPEATLARLARALTPDGVLELMVYNQFHRVHTAAFQAGLRILTATSRGPDVEVEYPAARSLVQALAGHSPMTPLFEQLADSPVEAFCDALLQPVEHSYTVGSLASMAGSVGLDLLTFTVDPFSRSRGLLDWNLRLPDPALAERYEALPDLDRWNVTNHLMVEATPMLWFYLQREGSSWPRKSERQICLEFGEQRFRRATTALERHVRQPDGRYRRLERTLRFPGAPRAGTEGALYAALDESRPISASFDGVVEDRSFLAMNLLRIKLASSAFPFLLACGEIP